MVKFKFKKHPFHNLQGEDKNQKLIVVNRWGRKKAIASREVCHQGRGKRHLAFMAFVFDKEGKVILTKRSKVKSLWGGYWDASVVSHVLPGETPKSAAKRRAKEELGIEVDFENLAAFSYFAKFEKNCENEYCYILSGKTTQEVFPNPVEIEEIRKLNWEDLRRELKEKAKIFTPWLKIGLEKINFFFPDKKILSKQKNKLCHIL